MKTSWISGLVLLSAAAALLSACGAGYEEGSGEDAWQAADSEEEAVADDELVLGTAEQGLTYPYCVSAASDPDGDGWGWENNQSCIVKKTTTTTTTTGGMTCSNPDGTNSVMA